MLRRLSGTKRDANMVNKDVRLSHRKRTHFRSTVNDDWNSEGLWFINQNGCSHNLYVYLI